MLSSVRNQRDRSLCRKIFDQTHRHFPNDEDCLNSTTLLLAHTYDLSGDLSTAFDIRYKLSQSGLKKKMGISSTVVNGQLVVSGRWLSDRNRILC